MNNSTAKRFWDSVPGAEIVDKSVFLGTLVFVILVGGLGIAGVLPSPH